MSQKMHPVPYFQSGSPLTDEYLASHTFLNGSIYPYPGMVGQTVEFQMGTPGAWNLGEFQLVKAASGVTPALGDLLYWSDRTIFEVTTAVTSEIVAGFAPVLMTAAASAFWMVLIGDQRGGTRDVLYSVVDDGPGEQRHGRGDDCPSAHSREVPGGGVRDALRQVPGERQERALVC